MMIKLLLFLGIILSIVKANGWFIVPMPVLVFCWVGSFVCWMIYSYALGVGEGAAKEGQAERILLHRQRGSTSAAVCQSRKCRGPFGAPVGEV